MKRGEKAMIKLIAVSTLVIFLTSAMALYAQDVVSKFNGGVMNVIKSPLEVAQGMKEARKEGEHASVLPLNGYDSALTWGLIDGVLRGGIRAIVGVYEVITCNINEKRQILNDVGDKTFFK